MLFNWPTTGGGNVHTYELAMFLSQAGYEVKHIFLRYEPWRIGQIQGLSCTSAAKSWVGCST